MSKKVANIYEKAGDSRLNEEAKRLENLDLPYGVSVEFIGDIPAGTKLLDIGAGPNTSINKYVKSKSGDYTALDKKDSFLESQKLAGANTVKGDIRHLPFDNDTFDITHTRFVISHLGDDKQQAVREAIRVTKSGGRAIFMDYDWTTAHGSVTFEKVKDFMINGGFLFDADFGAELEDSVRSSGAFGEIASSNHEATPMTDYSQILKLREAGSTDLEDQGQAEAAKEWNEILDEFQKEAESQDPPDFYFPGIKVVVLTKD
ncbi:MAG TPA: methyltransferase domain-containing protein [Candidatus Saccharimonadales bacterium]|jgi:ubiquinone/menaquinone biosynthesis C-methylase UbiE